MIKLICISIAIWAFVNALVGFKTLSEMDNINQKEDER
tara:strand:- start:1505 stop:1618 length:114 start_codon:yes stop_codon:yes gene_type:complete